MPSQAARGSSTIVRIGHPYRLEMSDPGSGTTTRTSSSPAPVRLRSGRRSCDAKRNLADRRVRLGASRRAHGAQTPRRPAHRGSRPGVRAPGDTPRRGLSASGSPLAGTLCHRGDETRRILSRGHGVRAKRPRPGTATPRSGELEAGVGAASRGTCPCAVCTHWEPYALPKRGSP